MERLSAGSEDGDALVFAYAQVIEGSAHNVDMMTGLCVTRRAMCWKFMKNPQSPVMMDTPFASSHLTAFVNRSSISGGIFPDWHMANVRPGTTR